MGTKRKVSKQVGAYPFDFRLKIVKLFTEEGYGTSELSEEFGCSKSVISSWMRAYRKHGEDGLYTPSTHHTKPVKQLNSNLKSTIIELKKADPQRGVKRISDILKRFFLLQASPGTVSKALHEEKLIAPPPKKRRKNISVPRHFERSTPNQMWQTDICTFRLAGKNAYLLGFIDDYSRYIVGLGLYRSQTSVNLLEVYRTAVGEYGVPQEMLTDNGRQYTNWRGTTNFERELKKDRIKHIKSSPHHPMTLGKIERFWKTILSEFLFRCQFDSFENARERLALWVKYYNCKRPHQGISGLCPADRFFEVQNELKQTVEKGIEDNILEMALRGKPQKPFYMVGRMGGQNLMIRAEKGKIRMHVDDPERIEGKELVYDLNAEDIDGREEASVAGNNSNGTSEQKTACQTPYSCTGQMPGGAFSVDGKPFSELDLPGIIGYAGADTALAGDSDGGNAAGAGSGAAQSEDNGFEQPSGEVINESGNREEAAAGGPTPANGGECGAFISQESIREDSEYEEEQNERSRRPQACRTYFKGKKRDYDRYRRRFRARRF